MRSQRPDYPLEGYNGDELVSFVVYPDGGLAGIGPQIARDGTQVPGGIMVYESQTEAQIYADLAKGHLDTRTLDEALDVAEREQAVLYVKQATGSVFSISNYHNPSSDSRLGKRSPDEADVIQAASFMIGGWRRADREARTP